LLAAGVAAYQIDEAFWLYDLMRRADHKLALRQQERSAMLKRRRGAGGKGHDIELDRLIAINYGLVFKPARARLAEAEQKLATALAPLPDLPRR
jgi:hypothetical protein